MKKMLVVVDMIKGFLEEGALADKNINRIVSAIIEKIEQAKCNGDTIVAFADCHSENDEEFKLFPPHCIDGTLESQIIDALQPYLKDMILIKKNTTNGFNTPEFKKILKENKFDKIEITGCCTDICVSALTESLVKYFEKEKISTPIVIDERCVDTFSSEGHEADKVNKDCLERFIDMGVQVIKKEDETFKPVKIKKVTKGKFLNMFEVTYKNKQGQIKYEMVTRKKLPECIKPTLQSDAVQIIPYSYTNGSCVVHLIKEFRYAIGDYIYDLPAGIVEKGEDGRTTAIRELEEEIGGKVKHIMQSETSSYTSAGMSDESIECYEAEVEIKEKQNLQDNEDIQVVSTKLEDIEKLLESKKFGIQAKLQLRSFVRQQRIKQLEKRLTEFEREDI